MVLLSRDKFYLKIKKNYRKENVEDGSDLES